MALTASSMINLGTVAPDFNLSDVRTGKAVNFAAAKGEKGTLVLFICNHCPYVLHVMPEVLRVVRDFPQLGVVAISSNDVIAYPQDGPEKMAAFAEEWGMDFPYLYDESQDVAKAYDAACTPDFYLFDHRDKLVYRGRLDESRPREAQPQPLTGKDLRGAIKALVSGQMLSEIQFPSMGCNIKWK